jgi:inositol transport system substrate-binding protein
MMIMTQKALIPALTRAKDAHIPVVLINTLIPQEDLYTAFVGEDSKALGGIADKAMADGLEKGGRTAANVAVIAGSMDESVAPVRANGFKQALEQHPGYKVVAVEETHWARQRPNALRANCWRAFRDGAGSTASTE